MVRPFRWIKNRIKALDLFFVYVEFCGRHWQEVLGGPIVIFLAWNVWFYVGNPPAWVNWTAILFALLIAGYYAWRVDHVRLMPKLGLGDIKMNYAGFPEQLNKKRRYVKVLVKCETESPIKGCGGQLLRVSKWNLADGKWDITHLNETLDLEWSFVAPATPTSFINMEHGAPRQLNVFWVENTNRNMVVCTHYHPNLASTPSDRFKFDVRVAGEECPPVYASLEVTIGNEWCDLEVVKNENGSRTNV